MGTCVENRMMTVLDLTNLKALAISAPSTLAWLLTGDLEETEEEEGAGNALRTTTTSRIR